MNLIWPGEREKLELFVGRKFQTKVRDIVYLFRADTCVEYSNEGRRPFLLAWPIRKISGSSKPIHHAMTFTADELPEKP